MEHVLKGRGIDTPEQSVQHTADEEGDKVTITDLEHLDPLGESKDSWLTSPLLRWQRSPYRRRWRLTGTVSFLLLLLPSWRASEGFTHHQPIPLPQVQLFLSFLSGMASPV